MFGGLLKQRHYSWQALTALGRFAAQSSDRNLNQTHVAVIEAELCLIHLYQMLQYIYAYGLSKLMNLNSYATVPMFYSSNSKIKTFTMSRKYSTHLINLMLSVV